MYGSKKVSTSKTAYAGHEDVLYSNNFKNHLSLVHTHLQCWFFYCIANHSFVYKRWVCNRKSGFKVHYSISTMAFLYCCECEFKLVIRFWTLLRSSLHTVPNSRDYHGPVHVNFAVARQIYVGLLPTSSWSAQVDVISSPSQIPLPNKNWVVTVRICRYCWLRASQIRESWKG